MESLPHKIKRLREDRGWTQRDLTKKAGGVAVANIEKGKRPNVQHDTIVAIAKAFGMTADELTHGTEPMENSKAVKRAKKVELTIVRAHVSTHLEQVLEEYGDRLTYKQSKDLEAQAAAKGATLEEIRAMAKHMTTKPEKRMPEREASRPEKRPRPRG